MEYVLVDWLLTIQNSMGYKIFLVFFGLYPVVTSSMWIIDALIFRRRNEKQQRSLVHEDEQAKAFTPPVSILIPAYCEERVITHTLTRCLEVDYPDYEIVVVDDGSTDRTSEMVMPFVEKGQVRLVKKDKNEGKAMALNDGVACCRGEIILIIDADAFPEPSILKHMVPHFTSARVAAVTGNPRVYNRETFVSKLQLIEFTSIVSVLRRAQRVMGRVLTVSGVVAAFRKSAMIDAGLFSPNFATEDIELTWKLQGRYYDVRYEPQALVWMQVPPTLRALWRQRRRWATGLIQVLIAHGSFLFKWKKRRFWPVIWESIASIIWAYTLIAMLALWAFSYIMGIPPVGAHPVPNFWGMVIFTMALVQIVTGFSVDKSYDRSIMGYALGIVFYPLFYWIFMSLVTVVTTPLVVFKPHKKQNVLWKTERVWTAEA